MDFVTQGKKGRPADFPCYQSLCVATVSKPAAGSSLIFTIPDARVGSILSLQGVEFWLHISPQHQTIPLKLHMVEFLSCRGGKKGS